MFSTSPRWTWPTGQSPCRFIGSIRLNQQYDVYRGAGSRNSSTIVVRFGPAPENIRTENLDIVQQAILTNAELQPWLQAILLVLVKQS